MQYRSWMLVPGDHEKKLSMAAGTGADVIVLDLEGVQSREAKLAARQPVCDWLTAHRDQITGRPMGRWVRINALESRMWRDDLIAIMPGQPDGVILPKALSPESVREIAAEIYELEPRYGVASGTVKIIATTGETARAAMTIASYIDASLPRFAGLTWGTANLVASLGAKRHADAKGALTDTFRHVRGQTLLTAQACGVMAIDRMCDAPPSNEKAALAAAKDARADGFTGMFANHPVQVRAINAAFTPSEAELQGARAVLAAVEASVATGAALDRRLINRPDVQQAKRILETVEPAPHHPAKMASLTGLRPA